MPPREALTGLSGDFFEHKRLTQQVQSKLSSQAPWRQRVCGDLWKFGCWWMLVVGGGREGSCSGYPWIILRSEGGRWLALTITSNRQPSLTQPSPTMISHDSPSATFIDHPKPIIHHQVSPIKTHGLPMFALQKPWFHPWFHHVKSHHYPSG